MSFHKNYLTETTFLWFSNSKCVGHHHITWDLYVLPFRIAFPMMQRCRHNNISPFQNQGGSNSRKGIGSPKWRHRLWQFLHLKHLSLLFYRQVVLLLFSDACFLVCANELFLCRPGLKCLIGSRIFLPTASRLKECKQGRMSGCAGYVV